MKLKHPTRLTLISALLMAIITGCDKEEVTLKDPDENTTETFIDSRDGRNYEMVTIGSQVWMAENLKYLPSVVGPNTSSYTTAYYYVYGYDGTSTSSAKSTANFSTYGVLYNWGAATTACPDGWHLPTDAEWTQLAEYLGGALVAGGKLKEEGTTHWNSPNTGATNESGFTGLPGGSCSGGGLFSEQGDFGRWWTNTGEPGAPNNAYYRHLKSDNAVIFRGTYSKNAGISVCCVKD